MSRREPWPVRLYRRAAWTVGDLSADAADAFGSLYADERRRGLAAATHLWVRAMIDLLHAGAFITRPRPFAGFRHDLRWAWRTLRTRPGVSLVVIASIGLAIGANTAAFSVVNAFLWRSWGSRATDEVVRIREDYAAPGQPPGVRGFTMANFGPWQRANTVLEAMAAGRMTNATLVVDGRPERVAAGVVTANFFDVLGIRPALGRTFTAEEDTPDRRDAVLLGDALWRGRFGADRNIVGRTVRLNDRVRTIVGVMPRGLKHPYQSDLWVPIGDREDPTNSAGIYVPARLKPGVTLAQANQEMDAMAARLWRAHPTPDTPTGAQVTRLRPEMLGRLTRVLSALAGAALLVLLIAVANVSNLLLAQSLEQQNEAAVRTALGASRARLVRQFLTYGVLLSGVGGAIGVLLTFWSVGPLVALSPLYGAGEFDIEPRLDWTTLAFTIAMTMAVGVAFGVLPALGMLRARASDVLRAVGRSGTLSLGSRRWLKGLVVVELALAFDLLVGACVMGQGLLALRRETWGFDRRDVMTFDVAVPPVHYPDQTQQAAFVHDLIERLASVPGISSVGATSTPPFYAGTEAALFTIDGIPPPARGFFIAHSRAVTPHYFDALGIPLLAGRSFADADTATSVPVVILSQSMAERYWPGQNPIGRRVKRGRLDARAPWMEGVGVVGNLRENPDDDIPGSDAWYLPYRQPTAGAIAELTYAVKTSQGASIIPAVRNALAQSDPDVPIFDAVTMEERFARFTATERLSANLTAILGVMGVFLAAVGVYAVLAFSVRRRLPELGIRAALGARPSDVRRTVLREAALLIVLGVASGAAVSLFVRPLLDANLFQVGVSESVAATLAGIAVVLAATISTLVPAARAARIDPVRALAGR
ncbi:MAG TPA: ABC transporter permease [Vicinamibacterales bacterium]